MPKTKVGALVEQRKAEQLRNSLPEANEVVNLLERYMKAQGLTRADVGKKLGVSGQAVSTKLSQGLSKWSCDDIRKYAHACCCPISDAFDAAQKQYC